MKLTQNIVNNECQINVIINGVRIVYLFCNLIENILGYSSLLYSLKQKSAIAIVHCNNHSSKLQALAGAIVEAGQDLYRECTVFGLRIRH